MKIEGIAGLTAETNQQREVDRWRTVRHVPGYCISALVITFRRNSPVYFIRGGENATAKGLPWTLLTLVAGWWGFPWGLIWTPIALFNNLRGGKDVTNTLLPYFAQASATPQPGTWPPPPDFSIPT